jgi:hypothetical protein
MIILIPTFEARDMKCAQCPKAATFSVEVTSDWSTVTWKFFCSTTCEANWGTNQPKTGG